MSVSSSLRLLSWPPLPLEMREQLARGPAAPFEFIDATADDLDEQLSCPDIDLVLLALDDLPAAVALPSLAASHPVVLVGNAGFDDARLAPGLATRWLAAIESGVQDLLCHDDFRSPVAGLRLRAAVGRHRMATLQRHAFSTDPATGLPHQQQFLEHMNQLLALREREPAPMALLVLSVDGLATTLDRLGGEAGAVLRRKLAVRLRSGLRASDVVASLGGEQFGVLLSWVDAAADVDRVVAKLSATARRPFLIAGQPVGLSVSIGVGRYPEDGQLADVLLHKAMARSTQAAAQGELFARSMASGVAANDDDI